MKSALFIRNWNKEEALYPLFLAAYQKEDLCIVSDASFENDERIVSIGECGPMQIYDWLHERKRLDTLEGFLREHQVKVIYCDSLYDIGIVARMAASVLHIPLILLTDKEEVSLEEYLSGLRWPNIRREKIYAAHIRKLFDKVSIITFTESISLKKKLRKSGMEVYRFSSYSSDDFEETVQKLMEENDQPYRITDILYREESALLSVSNGRYKLEIQAGADAIVQYGLYRDKELDSETISALLREEKYLVAYLGALKKLSYSDRTVKEMHTYLKREFSLTEEDITKVINDLKSKGYLDDVRYARSKAESLRLQYNGDKKIRSALKLKGIQEEVINEVLQDTEESDRKETALACAEKLNSAIHNKTEKARKQSIRQKMMQRGFSSKEIDEALSEMDLSINEEEKEDLLSSQFSKVLHKYQRKYRGKELKNAVIRSLLTQGFEYENIVLKWNQTEEDDEEICEGNE